MRSLFSPVVLVDDNGLIEVDFADSYVNTELLDGRIDYDDPHDHGEYLDGVLGPGSTVDRLRRLADYIEGLTPVTDEDVQAAIDSIVGKS